MTKEERIAALQARRAARGDADPLNRLRAHVSGAIARGDAEAVTAIDRINAALAAPKTHRVVTTFADGATRHHDTRSAASAETYAVGERRKIGRDLISRDTGATVRVVSVTVESL